ncbi:MAG: hypothetical protein WCC64_14370 [Aliidongia sp.]
MGGPSEEKITMSAQSEAALLAREQFAESDPIDGSRLIGAVVDIPGLAGPVTGNKGGLGHAIGPSQRIPATMAVLNNPTQGAQLITEMVDLSSGLSASPAQGLPENLGHRIGPSPLFPAGAAPLGADTAAGQGQLHQLVTAMAGFGGDQGSVITNLTVQNEVEAARTSLAASLHFSQP